MPKIIRIPLCQVTLFFILLFHRISKVGHHANFQVVDHTVESRSFLVYNNKKKRGLRFCSEGKEKLYNTTMTMVTSKGMLSFLDLFSTQTIVMNHPLSCYFSAIEKKRQRTFLQHY